MAWHNWIPSFNPSALQVWFFLFLLLILAGGVVAWLLLPFSLLRLRPLLRQLLEETRTTNKLLEEVLGNRAAPRDPSVERLEPTLDGGRRRLCPSCESLIPLAALKCPRCGANVGSESLRTMKPVER